MHPDERDVFTAVLRERSRRDGPRFVIAKRLLSSVRYLSHSRPIGPLVVRWLRELPGLTEETASSFVNVNTVDGSLDALTVPGLSLALLAESDAEAIWSSEPESRSGGARDGWVEFRRLFPGATGVVHLSQVGFDLARRQALVEVAVQSHWLAGSCELVMLACESETWIPTGSLLLSVS